MSQTDDKKRTIEDSNRQVASLLIQERILHPDIVNDVLLQCNEKGENLGQILLRSHQLKVTEFARIMQKMKSVDPKTTASQKTTEPSFAGSTFTSLDGKKLANYEILKELGRGGMGIVYCARQLDIDRLVALKVLLTGPSADSSQLKRFFREARATMALRHPNIVCLYDMRQEKGFHYFTMQYVEGHTFEEVIKSQDIELSGKISILIKVCLALDHAHRQGILHRDIKPSNILVAKNGEPYLTDFGLAKFVDSKSALTQTGGTLGTPFYMSPEQVKGEKRDIDHRSDVYALGVILYQVLTRELPFMAENLVELYRKIGEHDPLPPSHIDASIPKALEEICLRVLEKNVKWRYASAGALAEDLRKFCQGEKVRIQKPPAYHKIVRRCKKHPRLAWSLLFVIVLSIVGGTLAIYGQASFQKKRLWESEANLKIAEARKIFQEDYKKATQMIEEAVKKNPDYWPLHLELGKFYLQQESYEKSRKAYENALRLAPDAADVLFEKSDFHYRRQEYDISLKLAEVYLHRSPSASKGYRKRAEIYDRLGERAKAQADIQKANVLEEEKARSAFERVQGEMGPDGQRNLGMISEFIRQYPDYAAAYERRALLYDVAGNRQNALQDISRATELDPRPRHYLLKARWLYEDGHLEKSKENFEIALAGLEKTDEKLEVVRMLARIELGLGHYEKAYTFYGQSKALLGKFPEIRLEMAQAAYGMKNYPLAQGHLSDLEDIQSLPSRILGEALRYKGLIGQKTGELGASIEAWEKSLRCDLPKASLREVYKGLGNAYMSRKEIPRAISYLLKAVELSPTDAALHKQLSQCYRENRQYEAAIQSLGKCIEIEPWVYDYYFTRGELYSRLKKLEESEEDFMFCLQLSPVNLEPMMKIFENIFEYGIPGDFQKVQLFYECVGRIASEVQIPDSFSHEMDQLRVESIQAAMSYPEASSKAEKPPNELWDEKKIRLFLEGLARSDSLAVQEMAYTALLKHSSHPELRRLLRKESTKEEYPPAVRSRIDYLRKRIEQHHFRREKILYRQRLVRYYQARDWKALLELYHQGEDGVYCLESMLEDKHENGIVRFLSARALGDLRTVLSDGVLRGKLTAQDPGVRVAASIALEKPKDMLDWAKETQDPYLRYLAVSHSFLERKLERFKPFLKEGDLRIRLAAAAQLRKSGEVDEEVERVLTDAFRSSSPLLKAHAISEYWKVSEIRKKNALFLFRFPYDPLKKDLRRIESSDNLRKYFEQNGHLLSSTTKLFFCKKSMEWVLQDEARRYYLLREIGKEDVVNVYLHDPHYDRVFKHWRGNLSHLLDSLKNEDSQVRRAALVRLLELGEQEHSKHVQEMLYDQDPLIRVIAILALAAREPDAISHIISDSREPLFIRFSVMLGGRIDEFRDAFGAFAGAGVKAMKDPDPRVRMVVTMVLEKVLGDRMYLGTKKQILPINLKRYSYSNDYAVRMGRVGALIGFGQDVEMSIPNAKEIVKALQEFKKDEEPRVRGLATAGIFIITSRHRLPELERFHQEALNSPPEEKKAAALGYIRTLNLSVPDSGLKNSFEIDVEKTYQNFIENFVEFVRPLPEERAPGDKEKGFRSKNEFLEGLSKAHQLNPDDFKVCFKIGVVYFLKRRYDKSIQYMSEALRTNPSFDFAKLWMARAYYEAGEYENAERMAGEAHRSLPWSKELCELQGRIAQKLGQEEKAKEFRKRMPLLEKKT